MPYGVFLPDDDDDMIYLCATLEAAKEKAEAYADMADTLDFPLPRIDVREVPEGAGPGLLDQGCGIRF